MSDLLAQLSFEKAYRKHRWQAAQWVLAHPESFNELLQIAFENDKQRSHKANWVLEFVFLEQPSLLYPHLDFFFSRLPNVSEDSSARPLSHICERVMVSYYKENETIVRTSLSEAHKKQLIECAFDWLLTDQKVACQVRAMTCLYYLGTEFDWIHPELSAILKRNISKGSAGYRSRGNKVLQQITRFSTQS
ncbi:hypothetical protein [Altibacter sp. HG106]|uniref:hypothetical protein n=1 Tax=Altibacter sp. HG106 TaxID=3023937 RepID=UPI00234FD033|nr:hypothetical protein [Altibacter sp. HG106]MDC7993745.1 hypothetical protein [Altibacter sp. HG106]